MNQETIHNHFYNHVNIHIHIHIHNYIIFILKIQILTKKIQNLKIRLTFIVRE